MHNCAIIWHQAEQETKSDQYSVKSLVCICLNHSQAISAACLADFLIVTNRN